MANQLSRIVREYVLSIDRLDFTVKGRICEVLDDKGDVRFYEWDVSHHLQNRSDRDAVVLEVGTRCPDDDCVFYPDIDLQVLKGRAGYAHRNGELYVGSKPRNPATGK